MKLIKFDNMNCPIAQSLDVIGERWTLLILRNCFMGTRRFDEFQQQLGLTRHLLADRLKTLVSHDVLKKVPYGEQGKRFEYRLTEKGLDLYPVILTLANWGNTWLFAPGQQPLQHIHHSCGQPTQPVLSCSHCGDTLDPRQVSLQSGATLDQLVTQTPATELVATLGYQPPASR